MLTEHSHELPVSVLFLGCCKVGILASMGLHVVALRIFWPGSYGVGCWAALPTLPEFPPESSAGVCGLGGCCKGRNPAIPWCGLALGDERRVGLSLDPVVVACSHHETRRGCIMAAVLVVMRSLTWKRRG